MAGPSHDGGRTNIEPANPGECPSGYFEVPSPYGQSQCITPSDTACAEQSLNAACTFSAGGISVEGVCSNLLGPLTCLATCSPDDGSNYPDSNETSCVNTNSVCQATGMLGDAATLGVCIPANRFQAASDCPGGSFAVDNGDGTFDCIPPSGIGCNIEDATDNGAVDLSTTGSTCSFSHGGHALIGVCSGSTPGAQICLERCSALSDTGFTAFYTANARPTCDNPNSVCQPSGIIGDPDTYGACFPRDIGCGGDYDEAVADGASPEAAQASADAAAPAGTFGCSLQGATLVPSIPDCTTGYVCADPATGAPTEQACNPDAAEGLSGCADDALCVIPIFGSTGTRCLIDGDNDGADDKDGFCVELPGDDQGASACLPDCAALDGGDVTSCVAVDSEGEGTAYCQPLEARGMGLLVDLSDNGAADGSAGHPAPHDRAVCIGPDSACSDDSECDTATSIGCSAGVCMPPSLNACASGGVPGRGHRGNGLRCQ